MDGFRENKNICMEMSNSWDLLNMQLCKEAQLKKKIKAKVGLEHMTSEIVLHNALPPELSSSGDWTNVNSCFVPLTD